tara:strand:- start:1710 stop:1841 length:132 start_codon:yes stop_codon:yes gene_type:complete
MNFNAKYHPESVGINVIYGFKWQANGRVVTVNQVIRVLEPHQQ